MSFQINATCGMARSGTLTLSHGIVETPVFMPVGTSGVVKTLTPEEVLGVGSQIILGNTYHLFLRPGLEVLKTFGGLHSFMNWDRPILTDSGGFQVFSLGNLKKVSDEGVLFRNHLNGDSLLLTPELSAEIQQAIGSDIAMVFDQCISLPNTTEAIEESVLRSHLWSQRFLKVPARKSQKVFGIVQGGTSEKWRRESLDLTLSLNIDGLAIGGLSVGEPPSEMYAVLDLLAPHLPPKLPHYLMGVGTPIDLLEAVYRGIDMFDCVLPTRNARNGGFFTDGGLLNIRNQQYQFDRNPIAEECDCLCCQKFSRAYLRHLFLSKEILGCRLATIHNLHYYHRLMQKMKMALLDQSFNGLYAELGPKLREAYSKTEVT